MSISGINRPHTHSNDHWTAETVRQVAMLLPDTDAETSRSAVVIGNGMMPYLLPLIRPDLLVLTDINPLPPAYTLGEIRLVAQANSIDEFRSERTEEYDSKPYGSFDFSREFKRARKAGLASATGFAALKKAAQHVEVKTVIGDLTERATASQVRDALEGTQPVFINLTNVASALRTHGPLSSKKRGWSQTKKFLDRIGIPDDAVVVDSDEHLLHPRAFKRHSYRV
jgi:hypothetical protein